MPSCEQRKDSRKGLVDEREMVRVLSGDVESIRLEREMVRVLSGAVVEPGR